MSVRVMTLVWQLDLPDSDKIVLLALADCANDEGHCWPSVASLVRKCSKSERTIQASIKRLCEEGLLVRREVPGKGCNYSVLPRSGCTPAETAPPQRLTRTPAAAADKPSRTINTVAEATDSERVVAHWNDRAVAAGLKPIRVLDASRKQKLRLRIKEHGVEVMLEAVECVAVSKFLTGRAEKTYRANFDFILSPETLRKVLEGFYADDDKPQTRKPTKVDLEERAKFFDGIGKPDEAAEYRRRAALAQDNMPIGEIAAQIVGRVQ